MKKLLSVVLSLSMILSLFVCYIAVSAETVVANVASDNDGIVRIEAETGEKSGTATESTNANPSGGKAVGGIGGGSTVEQESYVLLKVNAPKAGRYVMTLAVNSADGATSGHNLSINGADPVTLSYPGSAAWIPVDVFVELEEGENTVKVSGIPGSGAWARLDYIELDFSKIIKRYEAEDGDVVGNNTYRADHNDASGGKFVAGLGGGSASEQNGSTTMTVNVPAAGVYTIKLRVKSIPEYLTEAGSGNNLTINGAAPITLAYPISETFIYHEVSVSLNAGDNAVKVSGIPGSAAWAQLDCIDVYVPVELYEEETTDIVERYEAEEGALDGANVSAEEAASGGYKVGGLGGSSSSEQIASVTMTVTVPKSGTYTIKLRVRVASQWAGAGSGHNLAINGGAPQTLSYTISDTFIYHSVQVELNGGENTVKVSGIPGSGAWGFLDCIDVYIPEEYFVSDFDALNAALDTYYAIYEDNEYCGEEARINFYAAYENADMVRCDENALPYQVDAAIEELVSAANALISNGKHVKSDEFTYDEYAHWYICANGCEVMLDYENHSGANGVCTVCPNVCEHNVTADDANCSSAAICTYCGTVVAEKNFENHTKPEEQWVNNQNGTHTIYYGCCDTYDETVGCEYGSDNVCDKCGYDRTTVINNALTNANNAFENIFKGGENEVVAVGPQDNMSDDYKVAKPAPVTGFTYAQFNLHFGENGEVFLRHHFIIEGDVTVTLNGEAVEFMNDGCPENVYYIDVAPEAGKYHIADTITVNGTTNIKVSLYSYIKIALESGTLNEKQETLLRALYDLNEAAK